MRLEMGRAAALMMAFWVAAGCDGTAPTGGNSDTATSDGTVQGDTVGGEADGSTPDVGPEAEAEQTPQDKFDVSGDVPYLTDLTDPNWDTFDVQIAEPEAEVGETSQDEAGGDGETTQAEVEDPFGECDEQGIAEKWKGAFEGDIYYDIESGGLLSPEQGIIPVYGELFFDVKCLNFKYIVEGKLSGIGQVETNLASGEYPFSINLGGTYYPETGKLSAKMTDGKVEIGPMEVYFEGHFIGYLLESATDFEGTWDGSALGTNVPQIYGTAEGVGTWDAAAQP